MKNIEHNFGKRISGIYCIMNLVNSKIYVGSSINIYKRINHHIKALEKNKHHSSYLQRSWNKYGKDNFYCFIIERIDSEQLLNREEFWINVLKADYNTVTKDITRFAAGFSPELRNQITESLKTAYKNGLQNPNKKKVYLYNLQGEFVREFSCAKECCEKLNLKRSTLSRWLNQGKSQSQEYQFKYEYFKSIPVIDKPVLHTEEHRRKISETVKQIWITKKTSIK